jgi:hypothetical protein
MIKVIGCGKIVGPTSTPILKRLKTFHKVKSTTSPCGISFEIEPLLLRIEGNENPKFKR